MSPVKQYCHISMKTRPLYLFAGNRIFVGKIVSGFQRIDWHGTGDNDVCEFLTFAFSSE